MSAVIESRNAAKHEKFMNGDLSTRYSKSDKFYNEKLFDGMNYWRTRYSKTSSYAFADRVSKNGDKAAVLVSSSHLFKTPYGTGLILDDKHVAYLKDWQVVPHTEYGKGTTGYDVVLDRKYFTPKESRMGNSGFSSNPKALSFDHWKEVATEQQLAGNYVSIFHS